MTWCYIIRNMIPTTVILDESIYKEARKKAIDERIAFTKVVNQALKTYLHTKKVAAKTPEFKLRVYHLGRIKTGLSRTDLYENI